MYSHYILGKFWYVWALESIALEKQNECKCIFSRLKVSILKKEVCSAGNPVMLLSEKHSAICWLSTLVSRMVLRVSGVDDSVTSAWFSCHDDQHPLFTKKNFFYFRASKNFQHLDILNSSSHNLGAELRTNHSHFFFFFTSSHTTTLSVGFWLPFI